jgi:hypothetical protein
MKIEINHWTDFLAPRGMKRRVSEALGIPYETVRCWGNGLKRPRRERRKDLLEYAKTELPAKEFKTFKESFTADVLGG